MFTPTAPGESGPYRALRDAGAVIVGVANMHEWGSSSTGNASVYGPAHNPWNLERCPGGSSSGPAAAVGSRMVGGAVGADGIGSIRYPAAYCGLTGLKPTFGRSAMQGHHLRGTTMIVSGPLCADAAGCRLLGSALFGEPLPAGEVRGLRIGVVRDRSGRTAPRPCARPARTRSRRCAPRPAAASRRSSFPGNEAVRDRRRLARRHRGGLGWLRRAKLNSMSKEIGPINRALVKYRMLMPGSVLG